MKNLGATLAFAASLACAPALAQRTPYASPWFVGVGVGQGSVNFTHVPSFLSDDEKDTVYQVRVGYRFHPNLGVFAEYQRHDKLEVQSYFIGVDMRF